MKVYSFEAARYVWPGATWVVTIYQREAKEVRQQLDKMGVKTAPLSFVLPLSQEHIPESAAYALGVIAGDKRTVSLLNDQILYRLDLDLDGQLPPDDPTKIYFEDFITKRDDEVFVDCGAYDGDTIKKLLEWQPVPRFVVGFEADQKNFGLLAGRVEEMVDGWMYPFAVTDHCGDVMFAQNGTPTSKIDGKGIPVLGVTLDACNFNLAPTFIKMDIEGSELAALWGARRLLKERMPVLAICAYHEPSHLWEIPLLIHAIQPNYELRLRRYAEGARELVWYALPKERIAE